MRHFILIFSAVSLFACSQGAGEVCQNTSDCDDGLVCTHESDERGFCQRAEDVETPPPADKDAGKEPLKNDDASIDAGADASTDAGTTSDDAG